MELKVCRIGVVKNVLVQRFYNCSHIFVVSLEKDVQFGLRVIKIIIHFVITHYMTSLFGMTEYNVRM